jgi:cyclase
VKALLLVCLLVVAPFLPVTAIAHRKHRPVQDYSNIQIKATKISGNVYMLEGSGGNIGVSVGPDGVLIVDDQYAPLAEKIKATLKSLGEGKLRFILNTHWHGDHTGGNEALGKEGTIIAHDNVRKRMSTEQRLEFFKTTVPASPRGALPVITFDQNLSVHFNGEEIRAVHLPNGHTDGDIIIFFTTSNVVHMGDDFFTGSFPFVDLDSGGSVQGLAKNIGEIIPKIPAGAKIIPGHGPISTIDDLKAYHRMLVETTSFIQKKVAAKKSLAEIKKEGLPAEWKSWGAGFIKTEQWIELVHHSLTKK